MRLSGVISEGFTSVRSECVANPGYVLLLSLTTVLSWLKRCFARSGSSTFASCTVSRSSYHAAHRYTAEDTLASKAGAVRPPARAHLTVLHCRWLTQMHMWTCSRVDAFLSAFLVSRLCTSHPSQHPGEVIHSARLPCSVNRLRKCGLSSAFISLCGQ